jgi:hypothetical protein
MKNSTSPLTNVSLIEFGISKLSINKTLAVPKNPSSFPNGLKEICTSKVNIICSTPSRPCSG